MDSKNSFHVGDRVSCKKYGEGTVIQINPDKDELYPVLVKWDSAYCGNFGMEYSTCFTKDGISDDDITCITRCGHTTVEKDPTNPSYYRSGGIECIEAIKASMPADSFQDFLKGQVFKYLWRYKGKNGLEDVKKARWYLGRLIQEVGGKEETGGGKETDNTLAEDQAAAPAGKDEAWEEVEKDVRNICGGFNTILEDTSRSRYLSGKSQTAHANRRRLLVCLENVHQWCEKLEAAYGFSASDGENNNGQNLDNIRK